MEISSALVRIAFLLLPGILGSKIYRKLRGRSRKKTWEDFTEILVFATISYLLAGLLLHFSGQRDSQELAHSLIALTPLLDDARPVIAKEVLFACGFSLLVSFAAGYAHQYGVLNRIGYRVRATRRLGDEDVWTTFLADRRTTWCYVRDHHLDLIYFACVRAYSESDERRELILGQVSVFTNTDATKLYEVPLMYLSRKPNDLTIEIPPVGEPV